jgi:hypothetical protein
MVAEMPDGLDAVAVRHPETNDNGVRKVLHATPTRTRSTSAVRPQFRPREDGTLWSGNRRP